MQLGLVTTPLPASVGGDRDVVERVEAELRQLQMTLQVTAVGRVAVPEMKDSTIDAADSSGYLGKERLAPCEIVLPLVVVRANRIDPAIEFSDRSAHDCPISSTEHAAIVKPMALE